jgi:hypothetical protein
MSLLKQGSIEAYLSIRVGTATEAIEWYKKVRSKHGMTSEIHARCSMRGYTGVFLARCSEFEKWFWMKAYLAFCF